jgi:hypothetical protein
MDQDVAWVVRGYLNLDTAQRAEFVTKVNEYINGNQATKDRIVKESRSPVIKMDMGPLGGICKCCGR